MGGGALAWGRPRGRCCDCGRLGPPGSRVPRGGRTRASEERQTAPWDCCRSRPTVRSLESVSGTPRVPGPHAGNRRSAPGRAPCGGRGRFRAEGSGACLTPLALARGGLAPVGWPGTSRQDPPAGRGAPSWGRAPRVAGRARPASCGLRKTTRGAGTSPCVVAHVRVGGPPGDEAVVSWGLRSAVCSTCRRGRGSWAPSSHLRDGGGSSARRAFPASEGPSSFGCLRADCL